MVNLELTNEELISLYHLLFNISNNDVADILEKVTFYKLYSRDELMEVVGENISSIFIKLLKLYEGE